MEEPDDPVQTIAYNNGPYAEGVSNQQRIMAGAGQVGVEVEGCKHGPRGSPGWNPSLDVTSGSGSAWRSVPKDLNELCLPSDL